MTNRHILVALTGAQGEDHVIAGAMTLAKRLQAHVAVACAVADRPVVYDITGVAVAPGYIEEVTKVMEKARGEMRREARHAFETAVAESKLPLVNHPACGQASTWYVGLHERDMVMADIGRLTDLIALCRPIGHGAIAQQELIEDSLFAVRRPVLILPYRVGDVGESAAVAWNGSLEAANALRAVVGILKPGAKVTLIQVGDLPATGIAAQHAVDYLGWEGFTAHVRHVEDKPKATAQIIMHEAKAANASLLVMGAFTHSRMREMFLGGVTATVLAKADLPVLMAH